MTDTATPEPHVEVQDLTMAYGSFVIQRDLNFTINRHDIFIIMGGSGCGKSTLLRSIIGLKQPAEGRIMLDGTSFWDIEPEERETMMRRFGILYQSGAPWSSMTGRQAGQWPTRRDLMPVAGWVLTISILGLGVIGLTGCGKSEPTRFYVLAYDGDTAFAGTTTTVRNGLGIGVGPVKMPEYLDRPQIVTRNSANHLQLAEFDQWGGKLAKNFTRVLAESFSSELSTDRVSLYPWRPSAPVDYQVTVRVTAFELDQAGDIRLDARWSIVDGKARKILLMARSSYREATGSGGSAIGDVVSYQAVAGAMSRNVQNLGHDIAAKIQSLSGR